MVLSVMGGQGWAWAVAAVVLVLLSTVTTAFLDIYSTVVSAQNLFLACPRGRATSLSACSARSSR